MYIDLKKTFKHKTKLNIIQLKLAISSVSKIFETDLQDVLSSICYLQYLLSREKSRAQTKQSEIRIRCMKFYMVRNFEQAFRVARCKSYSNL